MEKISTKNLVAALALKFGLPAREWDLMNLKDWLMANYDLSLTDTNTIKETCRELNIDLEIRRELAKEEINYLESIQGEFLKQTMDTISIEEFILMELGQGSPYLKDLNCYTKLQLKALKNLFESKDVEVSESYEGEKIVSRTTKGYIKAEKVRFAKSILEFKEYISKLGFDPSIVDDTYFRYARSKHNSVLEEHTLNRYLQEKGMELPSNVTFGTNNIEVYYIAEDREDSDQERLEEMLHCDENSSISLVYPKEIDVDWFGLSQWRFINWNMINTEEKASFVDSQEQHTNIDIEQVLENIKDEPNQTTKIVVETRVENGQKEYRIRGYIQDDWYRIKLCFNPLYLAQLKESQSLKLK